MHPRYPVLLDLRDRPCLVVGGGAVAERKVAGLRAAGAMVTVVAPVLTAPLSALADDGALRWEARRYRSGDQGADAPRWAFVCAATDDPLVNDRVAAEASAAASWANVATSPAGGPAALPAVHRRGPLTVAVSTGGVHPGAAAWLRDLAASAIGPEHLTALALVDQIRTATPGGGRPSWRTVVESGTLDLIREGREAEAKERLQACLSSSSD